VKAPVLCRLAPEQPAILLSVSSAFILERLRDPPRRAGSRPHSLFRPLFCFQGASTARWGSARPAVASSVERWCRGGPSGGRRRCRGLRGAEGQPIGGLGSVNFRARSRGSPTPFFPLRRSTQRRREGSGTDPPVHAGLLAVHDTPPCSSWRRRRSATPPGRPVRAATAPSAGPRRRASGRQPATGPQGSGSRSAPSVGIGAEEDLVAPRACGPRCRGPGR
jgi:hypothetical protein